MPFSHWASSCKHVTSGASEMHSHMLTMAEQKFCRTQAIAILKPFKESVVELTHVQVL